MPLSAEHYAAVLQELGFQKSLRRKYSMEYLHQTTGHVVYVSHSKVVPGIIIHPVLRPDVGDFSTVPGVSFLPSTHYYKHSSAFALFPKRINDKDPINYGLEFVAEDSESLRALLTRTLRGPSQRSVLSNIEDSASELDGITKTERAALIAARLGQRRWRQELDSIWKVCAITGCDIRELLRGSHIKPWRKCSNSERLDPNNGLLLRADVDALFDSGLITSSQTDGLYSRLL
jgi:hypothetical protein